MGRTDDLVRAYYHLHYVFHEDVPYERLALFHMAADNYGDNGFQKYAYGNEQGCIYDHGNKHGCVEDGTIPDGFTFSTGYSPLHDRGIPISGQSPWVMLYQSNRTGDDLPEHHGNLAFVVRHYEAQLGSEAVTTPHINVRHINNGAEQVSFELGVPFDENNKIIPAGSEIRATVEYLVPPAFKSSYYGLSDYLTAMPEHLFQSTEMAVTLARDNHIEVTPYVGTLVRTHPIELEAASGATAVRFVMSGGLGYTPLGDSWTRSA